VLALLTIGYTLRLERELESRLDQNARARADLQELSARLLRAQENERRTLALLIRPSMLDDFGLVPALNWYAREVTNRTGLNVVVEAGDAADNLPDEHKTCIYRLVQEAVNNAGRHANARTAEVVVRREDRRVLLTVRDDGAGFDTRFVRGLGLLGMEERVRRLGGSFRIDSNLGRGTAIEAELPVAEFVAANGHDAYSHSAG
jgi:signal transduction histidine kinase